MPIADVRTGNGDPIPSTARPNSVCKQRYEYIPVSGSCDSYIECRDYQRTDMSCPDGLNFNEKAMFPDYPCSYPTDVPCKAGAVSRSIISTKGCPRQYGFFPSPVAPKGDCGQYRMCIAGNYYDMLCPPGLAFNPATSTCDWPDQVPSCNAAVFLSFACPESTVDASGNPVITNHKYENDCYGFFTCQQGRARLLACDPGLAFDERVGRCVDEKNVPCASIKK
ncbi:protein obstructor-E-like [Melitaea cinxia]|uniref:protein obstructor-E-like n=1 Tax=Melitaea cinxia TaxID=113334 RepID=UPI001E271793|nr:protein obstructor-E-like [Melitaea cinxia]